LGKTSNGISQWTGQSSTPNLSIKNISITSLNGSDDPNGTSRTTCREAHVAAIQVNIDAAIAFPACKAPLGSSLREMDRTIVHAKSVNQKYFNHISQW
jgi:hypothetical protein